jgi:hypothetical protein
VNYIGKRRSEGSLVMGLQLNLAVGAKQRDTAVLTEPGEPGQGRMSTFSASRLAIAR